MGDHYPDKHVSYLKAADTKPSLLLKGDTPRLLDEWQTAPVLWDAVRFAVDQRSEPGQFILTGSAFPADIVFLTSPLEIAFAIVRGGWPASIGESEKVCLRHAIDYVEAIINADVSRVDGVDKNPARVRALMRSLSRNISTLATIKTIRDDIAMGDVEESISDKTISQYLNALDRIFVTENLPAWNPALRSKAAIRTSPKRQFVDPSIAAATLRLTPDRLV